MLTNSPVDVSLFDLGFCLSFSDLLCAKSTTQPNTGLFGLDINKFSDVTDVRSLVSLLDVCNFNKLGTEMEW